MRKKIRCPRCQSLSTKRDGKRWIGKERRYQKQIFVCLACHKHFSLRLKSWNMFRNKENAQRYVSAWALARRFTKFTDCRGDMNRLKNGKAPLELAGIDIAGIDYLNL